MGGDFVIQIRPDRRTRRALELFEQWPERTRRLQALLPHLAAEYVLAEILEKLPKGEEWSPYRDSLEVARVAGMPPDTSATVVRSNVHSRRVRRLDVPRTLLYVRAKRRLKTKPEVSVLEKYSPWTLQTLPFTPSRRDALLVTRRAGTRAVEKVAQERLKDRRKWKRELVRAGIKVKDDREVRIPRTVRALPDVAFEALRLEFGWGPEHKAHWKPAIRRLIVSGIKSMLRQGQMKRALTSVSFRGWKRWPPRTRYKVRMSEARNYLPFQRKLGIRR